MNGELSDGAASPKKRLNGQQQQAQKQSTVVASTPSTTESKRMAGTDTQEMTKPFRVIPIE